MKIASKNTGQFAVCMPMWDYYKKAVEDAVEKPTFQQETGLLRPSASQRRNKGNPVKRLVSQGLPKMEIRGFEPLAS